MKDRNDLIFKFYMYLLTTCFFFILVFVIPQIKYGYKSYHQIVNKLDTYLIATAPQDFSFLNIIYLPFQNGLIYFFILASFLGYFLEKTLKLKSDLNE